MSLRPQEERIQTALEQLAQGFQRCHVKTATVAATVATVHCHRSVTPSGFWIARHRFLNGQTHHPQLIAASSRAPLDGDACALTRAL